MNDQTRMTNDSVKLPKRSARAVRALGIGHSLGIGHWSLVIRLRTLVIRLRTPTIACFMLFSTIGFAADLRPEGDEFFEKQVRPVLVERCYKCHSASAEKLKGQLRQIGRAS